MPLSSLKLQKDRVKFKLYQCLPSGRCPYCHSRKATDLHEGIVKKGDVQTWPDDQKILIYCEQNCEVICRDCHMEHGQTSYFTTWFVKRKHKQGYDLANWLASLPFKVETMRTAYVRQLE